MSIEITFGGATFGTPGAYSVTTVLQTAGQTLTGAGVVAIIGESSMGAPGSVVGVQQFNSTQMPALFAMYGPGNITNAAKQVFNPSDDTTITSGASNLFIYKTNNSTQASANLPNISSSPATLFDVLSSNWGVTQNAVNVSVSQGETLDTQPFLESGVITFPVTLTATQTLTVTNNGTTYTYTQPGTVAYATPTTLLAALNTSGSWSSGPPVTFTAGTVADTIVCTLNTGGLYSDLWEYAELSIGGTGVELSCTFATTIAFTSDGSSGGTFETASIAGLQVGQFARIANDTPTYTEGIITSITGSVSPFTITVSTLGHGVLDLSIYTTAASSLVYVGGGVINNTTLATTPGSYGPTRGFRGSRVVTTNNGPTTELLDENPNAVALSIQYIGVSAGCTLSITQSGATTTLTTTTSSPSTPSENLSIVLNNFTIQQLASFIDNFGGGTLYNAATTYYNASVVNASFLDDYSAIDIQLLPINLKGAINEIETIVNNQSQLITFTQVPNIYGQLQTTTVPLFLTGGTLGGSSNMSFQNGFDAMLSQPINTVVSLVSQNASKDITAGLTDPSSTYTIQAIQAQSDAHCRLASSVLNRSERLGIVSIQDTFANSGTDAQLISSEFTQMCNQGVSVLDYNGNITQFQPWMAAVTAAGMRAGSDIGGALTFKYAKVFGLFTQDFNPLTDSEQAITYGLLFLQQVAGGFRWVVDNTTYDKDSNFAYNRGNVMAAAQYVAKNWRSQVENIMVGTKVSSTNAQSAVSISSQILGTFLNADILVGDAANNQLGYTSLTAVTNGSTTSLGAIITPVQANEFIPISIGLATIVQSAST